MGLIEAVCLASRFCGDSDAHTFPDNCTDLFHNRTRTVNMGYWWPNADRTPGKYTVEVTSIKPYCTANGDTTTRGIVNIDTFFVPVFSANFEVSNGKQCQIDYLIAQFLGWEKQC